MAQIWAIFIGAFLVLSGAIAVISGNENDSINNSEIDLYEKEKTIIDEIDDKENEDRIFERDENERFEDKDVFNKEVNNDIIELERIINEMRNEEKEILINFENNKKEINEIEKKIEIKKININELHEMLNNDEIENKDEIKEKIQRIEIEILEFKELLQKYYIRNEEMNIELLNIKREINEQKELIENINKNMENREKYQRENGMKLKIRWGYTDGEKHRNNREVSWDGGIYVTNGNLKLIKTIMFEQIRYNRGGDKILKSFNPNHISWNSITTTHWDGVIVHFQPINYINFDMKEPMRDLDEGEKKIFCEKENKKCNYVEETRCDDKNVKESREWEGKYEYRMKNQKPIEIINNEPTFIIIYTPHWKGVFNLEELNNIHEIITIDDFGHTIEIQSLKKQNRDIPKEGKPNREKPNLFVETVIFSEDDGIANDVLIKAYIDDRPLIRAKVILDNEPAGIINNEGFIELFNISPGGHYVMVDNGEFKGETKFYIDEYKIY